MITIDGHYAPTVHISLRLEGLLRTPTAGNTLTTEEFVFALLRERDCEIVEALRTMNVTEDTLRVAIRNVRKAQSRKAGA